MTDKIWTLGLIGCGNMGGALVRGVIKSGLLSPERVRVTDVDAAKAKAFAEELGVMALGNNTDIATQSDVVIFAAKPQNMAELLGELASVTAQPLYISIAAGISLMWMESRLGADARVVRVMPNTPAMIGCGAAGAARGKNVSDADMALTLDIFCAVGDALEVPESKINAVTGLSGSGPAYVFRMIEVMAKAGEKVGLEPAAALKLTLRTVLGAARMAVETGVAPAELRRRVTSPKGTTEAGLKAMEDGGFEELMEQAVSAATVRSEELGKLFAGN
ncbi:TPA: pyrroline-5-carboxylate reductase [Candidatus Sumerlaeota bacterium]|nr:pyrroline-5-carboxylate reductase [Candidatus Sumerlaeota bacterium]